MFTKLKIILNASTIDPLRLFFYLWHKVIIFWLQHKHNIFVKGKLFINGHPHIDIRTDCKLYIGNGVKLNSRNKGHHINMHSPVKLFADKPGAEIYIGDNTRIHGSCIHAYKSIVIGKNCLIAANCQIFDNNGHDLSFHNIKNRINTRGADQPIRIEDNVWLGANTIVLPGVIIGEGSIISANSVVAHNIPSMVIAGGNPAQIIKYFAEQQK